MTQRRVSLTAALALLGVVVLAPAAGAQIAVSGNDNKVLLVNGVVTVVATRRPIPCRSSTSRLPRPRSWAKSPLR